MNTNYSKGTRESILELYKFRIEALLYKITFLENHIEVMNLNN
jgi:hypothetical protein